MRETKMIPLISLNSSVQPNRSRCSSSIQQRSLLRRRNKRVRFAGDHREQPENGDKNTTLRTTAAAAKNRARSEERIKNNEENKNLREIKNFSTAGDDETSVENANNGQNFKWKESEDNSCVSFIFKEAATTTSTATHSEYDDDDDDDDDDDYSSSVLNQTTTEGERKRFPNIPIPDDPRLWSRLDVYNWLEHMKSREVDLGDLDPGRFLMNGKALCLMTPAMFVYRVPRGGVILYRDFQTRLCRAVAIVHHNNLI